MKTLLRKKLKSIIIPKERKEASGLWLLSCYLAAFDGKRVGSYTPFDNEIDSGPLNDYLARCGHLLLSQWRGSGPMIFVDELGNEALPELLIIPALGFDKRGYRLGQGFGHFDRYMACHPEIPTVGVIFKEQQIDEHVNWDKWDLPVGEVWIF